MEKLIEIKGIVKDYRVNVIRRVALDIYKGDLISVIGPNGCGKTTLVNIIGGLEKQTDGKINRFGKIKTGYVFQQYKESLLPWRNIFDNIKLPLELSKFSCMEKVDKIIREFGLERHKHKYPFQLSGGLAQLTAIARALVDEPDLLILDEPFKSLDFDVAQRMMQRVIRHCENNPITTILVSHDIDQAILFADRLIVISHAPAMVKRTFNVRLPRPRKLQYLQGDDFFQLKKEILQEFNR